MRKQILILGHNYATQFIDVYNQYTRLFNSSCYEVTVAYLTGENDEEVKKRTLAEHVLFLNASKKSIRGLKFVPIKQLLTLCREKNFHTVICHRFKPTYIMLWVAQFKRIPVLYFVMHELNTMQAFSRKCLIMALRRKNMIFAGVSNAVRDDMRKSLWCVPENRIVTLHNMIDFDLFEPELLPREKAREFLNLSEQAFVFGNLARLAPNKDHHHLLKAFAQVKANCPKAQLVIMGDGDLEKPLQALVTTLKLETSVHFTGFVPGAYRYMKAFDCFILSSTQEAFGRVLLEAMIARIPVIATEVHGIPEVVGGTGILVKPRHVKGLTDAMKQMYMTSREERVLQGEKAYHHALTHFSIPSFQKQFWQTFSVISQG